MAVIDYQCFEAVASRASGYDFCEFEFSVVLAFFWVYERALDPRVVCADEIDEFRNFFSVA